MVQLSMSPSPNRWQTPNLQLFRNLTAAGRFFQFSSPAGNQAGINRQDARNEISLPASTALELTALAEILDCNGLCHLNYSPNSKTSGLYWSAEIYTALPWLKADYPSQFPSPWHRVPPVIVWK